MSSPLTAEAAVLCTLHEPSIAGEILAAIRRQSAGQFSYSLGALHPALQRLERDGLVQSRVRARGVGRPRRYYELTAEGVGESHRLRQALISFESHPNDPCRPSPDPACALQALRECEDLSAACYEIQLHACQAR